MTIPLQTRIVYGPLISRRFGVSLGVNLLPNDQKVCNYDCGYCQYSRSGSAENPGFPDVDEIGLEVAQTLDDAKKNNRVIDWITIAGNGEPTLHPQFEEAVARVLSLRNKFLPQVRVGILSNSSTCHRTRIRKALESLDGRFMKLDVGGPAAFKIVNQPSGPEGWTPMIAGLRELKDVILQSLFFDGNEGNVEPRQIREWISLVDHIQPQSVQIYTIDRPTRMSGLRGVSKEILENIARQLTDQTGIPGNVY